MVEQQLAPRGICDTRVLEAMAHVSRHLFVPLDQRLRAYDDRALSIGFNQTISQPYIVALTLQALAFTGREKVLEVGAGCGYQTALLGRLAQKVIAVEIVPELAALACARVRYRGMDLVQVYQRDGTKGFIEEAPFDRIVVAAAAPNLPVALLEQLGCPGKLVIPVGVRDRQNLMLVEKNSEGVTETVLCPCLFVPLLSPA